MEMHPLDQFEISSLLFIQVGNFEISFTNSSLFMVFAAAITLWFMKSGTDRGALIPGRLQAAAEMAYEFIYGMLTDQTGSKGKEFFPFIFTIFMLVLLGNLLGLVPYSFTFTSHIAVTFTLALMVFFTVTAVGFIKHGTHFFSFFMPHGAPMWLAPILIPIEVISYLSRPFSLGIRLFANMMAGHILLKVLAYISIALGVLGIVPTIFNVALIGLELMVAVLQAYVFTILSCVYLKDALELH